MWFYRTSSSLVPGTIFRMTVARVRQAAAGRRTGFLCRQFAPGQIAALADDLHPVKSPRPGLLNKLACETRARVLDAERGPSKE